MAHSNKGPFRHNYNSTTKIELTIKLYQYLHCLVLLGLKRNL